LKFKRFDLSDRLEADNFRHDFLDIRDGPNMYSKELLWFTGNDLPPVVTAYSGAVTLHFFTFKEDGGASSGFELEYSISVCKNDCTSIDNGYCFNFTCECDAGFRGEDCSETFCENECGGESRGKCDNDRCECEDGWYGGDCQDPYCEIGTLLDNLEGNFTDHHHELSGKGSYLHNAACTWLLQPAHPNIDHIELTFEKFETEKEYDFVVVYDGGDAHAPVMGNYSGYINKPFTVYSTGPRLFVTFTSDVGLSFGGFTAAWKTVFKANGGGGEDLQKCTEIPVKYELSKFSAHIKSVVFVPATKKDQECEDLKCLDHDDDVIVVVTETGEAHHSVDSGKTFKHAFGGPLTPIGRVESILTTSKPGLMVVRARLPQSNLQLYPYDGTTDLDSSLAMKLDGDVKAVVSHPHKPTVLAAVTGVYQCDNIFQSRCSLKLFYSTDFGRTWIKVADRVTLLDLAWFATEDVSPSEYHLVAGVTDNHFWSSTWTLTLFTLNDAGVVHEKTILNDCVGSLMSSSMLFAAQSSTHSPSLSLWVSFSPKEDFTEVKFPSRFSEIQYTIVDTTENATFIFVGHHQFSAGGAWAQWGNIYSSNSMRTDFVRVLDHVLLKTTAQFARINGIEGVYFANVIEDFDGDRPDIDSVKTMITYNKGGSWEYIEPSSHANCKNSDTCSLNLYFPIKSFTTAPGILLSSGIDAEYLDLSNPPNLEAIDFYMSTTAGEKWTRVSREEHLYSLGDQGSLVVMFNKEREEWTLRFSWDDGVTLSECIIPELEDVILSYLEPLTELATAQFIAHGYNKKTEEAIVVALDFTDMTTKKCNKDDYQVWIPTSHKSKCLLGMQRGFLRKKAHAQCFNPGLEKEFVHERCPCSEIDYECDWCYTRDSKGKCVLDVLDDLCDDFDPSKPPSPCNGQWSMSQGYRLISNDGCDVDLEGAVNWLPIQKTCVGFSPPPTPSQSPSRSKSKQPSQTHTAMPTSTPTYTPMPSASASPTRLPAAPDTPSPRPTMSPSNFPSISASPSPYSNIFRTTTPTVSPHPPPVIDHDGSKNSDSGGSSHAGLIVFLVLLVLVLAGVAVFVLVKKDIITLPFLGGSSGYSRVPTGDSASEQGSLLSRFMGPRTQGYAPVATTEDGGFPPSQTLMDDDEI